LAYEAFKDNYADVIQEYAEKGINQAVWEKPRLMKSESRWKMLYFLCANRRSCCVKTWMAIKIQLKYVNQKVLICV
ncbi:hypothetical protein OKC24_18230, partial [Acinetobacter sp. BIT-DXN8]|nr:hypothetical protein [Acinetobacter entericus]